MAVAHIRRKQNESKAVGSDVSIQGRCKVGQQGSRLVIRVEVF